MLPKEIIEKAIEGGWDCKGELGGNGLGTPKWEFETSKTLTIHKVIFGFGGDPTRIAVGIDVHEITLDPLFWQSLGKALGWCTHDEARWEDGLCVDCYSEKSAPQWKERAHRFYDLVLSGSNTDAFWQELLDNK